MVRLQAVLVVKGRRGDRLPAFLCRRRAPNPHQNTMQLVRLMKIRLPMPLGSFCTLKHLARASQAERVA